MPLKSATFSNPRAMETLLMLAENFSDLQYEEDNDGTIYFNIEEEGIIHSGYIPSDDDRVTWLG